MILLSENSNDNHCVFVTPQHVELRVTREGQVV